MYIHTGYFYWPKHEEDEGDLYYEEIDVPSSNPDPESARADLLKAAEEDLMPGWELHTIGTPSCGTVTFWR